MGLREADFLRHPKETELMASTQAVLAQKTSPGRSAPQKEKAFLQRSNDEKSKWSQTVWIPRQSLEHKLILFDEPPKRKDRRTLWLVTTKSLAGLSWIRTRILTRSPRKKRRKRWRKRLPVLLKVLYPRMALLQWVSKKELLWIRVLKKCHNIKRMPLRSHMVIFTE